MTLKSLRIALFASVAALAAGCAEAPVTAPDYGADLFDPDANVDGLGEAGLEDEGTAFPDLFDPGHEAGTCSVDPDCNDDDSCTFDVCLSGKCSFTPISCDDLDPCTTDSCDKVIGCNHVIVPNCGTGTCKTDADCDDGNLCSVDACNKATGKCTSTAVNCSDGDACTIDYCLPGTGCQHELDPACGGCTSDKQCDDSDPCTVDKCDKTVDPADCTHLTVADGIACDDDNACTTGETCLVGVCIGEARDCNDDDACTNDFCLDGECQHHTASGCCKTAADCEDYNPCTTDSCDSSLGCQHTPVPDCGKCVNDAQCNDTNLCTTDKCVGNSCLHVLKTCLDNNKCTDDSCDPPTGKCIFTPNSLACDDGSLCTVNDYCLNGICKGGPYANCDDGDKCTTDTCGPKTGCQHAPVSGCTSTCTADSQCNDNSACTTDKCVSSKCTHATVNCDDANDCTTDSCDATTGCKHAAVPNCGGCTSATQCDDKNACTTDTCTGGKCGHAAKTCTDGNKCTDDTCNTTTGACVFTPNTATCDDGSKCTVSDYCSAGVCKGGSYANCDDGDKCTTDSCVPATGCQHVKIANCGTCTTDTQCNDSNACTTDKCTAGKCTYTTKTCNDGNTCTTDSCSATTGACTFTPNTLSCSDGSACTTGDVCKNGVCTGGPYVNCDDGNKCTKDTCVPATGCKHEAIAGCT